MLVLVISSQAQHLLNKGEKCPRSVKDIFWNQITSNTNRMSKCLKAVQAEASLELNQDQSTGETAG